MINMDDFQNAFDVCKEWFEYDNDLCLDILCEIVQKYFIISDDEDCFNTMMELVDNYHIFLISKNSSSFKTLQIKHYNYYLDFDLIQTNDRLYNC
jgi:hypothetical protein